MNRGNSTNTNCTNKIVVEQSGERYSNFTLR